MLRTRRIAAGFAQVFKAIEFVNNYVYNKGVTCSEFKRWLAGRGATFQPAKGSHVKVYCSGRTAILPVHPGKKIKTGTAEGIKKQLGLKSEGPSMIAYPAKVTEDHEDGGYVVTFPDIPEATTQGDSIREALKHAAEALESALDFYFEVYRMVPMPSAIRKGMYPVELPSSMAAKILLLNTMIENKVRPAELARRIGSTRQDVQRLTNLKHASKIDGIAKALRALGKTMEIRLVATPIRAVPAKRKERRLRVAG